MSLPKLGQGGRLISRAWVGQRVTPPPTVRPAAPRRVAAVKKSWSCSSITFAARDPPAGDEGTIGSAWFEEQHGQANTVHPYDWYERTNEIDPRPTCVDGHRPLTLEHQLTGAPQEARKASGGQLILVTASGASRPWVLSGVGGRSRPYITPGVRRGPVSEFPER